MVVTGYRAAFRARLDPGFCDALEGTSLLEAPVASLLHLDAPEPLVVSVDGATL